MTKYQIIQQENKEKLLKINPNLCDESGIYFLTRTDEDNIRYAYIGQSTHILTRLAEHLVSFQHIDVSIKKYGFYSDDNIYGWSIDFLTFPIHLLDEKEQFYIKQFALAGYQLRNKTTGGQGKGKRQIDEYRPPKGYRDGLKQGYKNASKDVAHLFEKYLNYSTKSDNPNKYQQNAIQKFEEFLNAFKDQ